jgi:hypothetical protein
VGAWAEWRFQFVPIREFDRDCLALCLQSAARELPQGGAEVAELGFNLRKGGRESQTAISDARACDLGTWER